jgi:hypothetical protein
MNRRHDPEDYYPGPDEYHGPDWGRTFAGRCTRCGTVIYVTLDSLNKVCNRRYLHAPEYRALLDLRPDRDEMRWRHLREYKRRMAADVDAIRQRAAAKTAARRRNLRVVGQ